MKISSVHELTRIAAEFKEAIGKFSATISICGGTGCLASGARNLIPVVEKVLNKHNLTESVRLIVTGCQGFCGQGPLMVIRPGEFLDTNVKPEWIGEIITESVIKGKPAGKYLYRDPATDKAVEKESDIPFYSKQNRLLTGNNSKIDPSDIRDYISIGGYQALGKAFFNLEPSGIIDEISKAGLRGRGGGGFPTGRKWSSAVKASGDHKWVICNADEGNPGAFMDGSILEGNPHLVVEGMIIGAFAIGANRGYVYVRNEYPHALASITNAIDQAREWGLLGENILGSGFDFDISINRGGGAFVCGESTALMASLEGKPGEPRAKYVHTVEHGYHNEPTVLNNVETWANVPRIIGEGADRFSSLGSNGSPGTKVFSLVGNIENPGLVEITMDSTLRTLIMDIGGGIPGGKKFKAVQTGGPSGGCLPESLLDLPLDFDSLDEAGSMLGAGGIIVLDEDTCMVDLALHFIRFEELESCGKCTPCREGLKELDRILERITKGEGETKDLDYLEEIGEWMKAGSLCALGTSAANPVLSTLRYFRDEYTDHISQQKCPAGVCRALIDYRVIEENCTGCGECAAVCPTGAVSGVKNKPHSIDRLLCIKCNECYKVCKFDAIIK
jgi:NADH-quinone oxidoreductase subunit F